MRLKKQQQQKNGFEGGYQLKAGQKITYLLQASVHPVSSNDDVCPTNRPR